MLVLTANPGVFAVPVSLTDFAIAIGGTLLIVALIMGAVMEFRRVSSLFIRVTSVALAIAVPLLGGGLVFGTQENLELENEYTRNVSVWLNTEYAVDVKPDDINPRFGKDGDRIVGTLDGRDVVVNLSIVDGQVIAANGDHEAFDAAR